MTRVRCLAPPVVNRKEGVALWHEGDEDTVEMSGYWQGHVDRGALEIVDGEPDTRATVTAPEVGKSYTIGKGKIITVVSLSEKAAIVDCEGAKKPFPIQLSKWNGVEVKG